MTGAEKIKLSDDASSRSKRTNAKPLHKADVIGGCGLAVRKKKSFIATSFRNRPSHVPMAVEHRPEILFVCNSGVATETLITLLECAEYSITHAENKNDAVNWLLRRTFEVMVLDRSVSEHQDLRTEAEWRGVPVIEIATRRQGYTNSGISVPTVKELLATLFKLAPLEWTKPKTGSSLIPYSSPAFPSSSDRHVQQRGGPSQSAGVRRR